MYIRIFRARSATALLVAGAVSVSARGLPSSELHVDEPRRAADGDERRLLRRHEHRVQRHARLGRPVPAHRVGRRAEPRRAVGGGGADERLDRFPGRGRHAERALPVRGPDPTFTMRPPPPPPQPPQRSSSGRKASVTRRVPCRLVAITCSGVALAERPMPALFTSACSRPPPSPPSRRPRLASTCAAAAATEAASETSMVTSSTRPAQSAGRSSDATAASPRAVSREPISTWQPCSVATTARGRFRCCRR